MERPALQYNSIAALRDALAKKETTVAQVAERYLENIEQRNGDINAFNAMNEHLREEAASLDRLDPSQWGPLYGVPIAIKDNMETAGIATSFGSKGVSYVPAQDATLVRKLREAGALIVGKTAIPDWCASFFSTSSFSGTTQNPHDLTRDSGGSSAGSGAAVAADMVLAAIGGDTWGSVRLPASYCGLFGFRCTPGRISSNGLQPLLARQDTAGPITHSVQCAATLLQVLVGFDEADNATAVNKCGHASRNFVDAVKSPTLQDKRLGVVREVFGKHPGIILTTNGALSRFKQAGATVIDVEIPHLAHYKDNTFFHYVEELHAKGIYHPVQDHVDLLVDGPDDPTTHARYAKGLLTQIAFQNEVLAVFARHDLDALVFPTSQVLPPKTEDLLTKKVLTVPYQTNTVIAAQLLFPAASVPIGTTWDSESEAEAVKLPIGLEIVGLPLHEEDLMAVAAGIEAAVESR